MRIGIGHDIHRLAPTVRKSFLPLGGANVPCFYSVEAHSDGDVVLHAVVDACLGALALGDIGQHFPDNDQKNAGRKSSEFLQAVIQKVHNLGWRINNVDVNIFLEEPKLSPHIDAIRGSLAQLLKIEMSSTSVKAKTMERLGPVGERKAIAADAVVTLIEDSKGGTSVN